MSEELKKAIERCCNLGLQPFIEEIIDRKIRETKQIDRATLELKEENRQLRDLINEYRNRIESHTKSIIDSNKEINSLKQEKEKLKTEASYQQTEIRRLVCAFDKQEPELKNKVIELENRLQNIKEMARL